MNETYEYLKALVEDIQEGALGEPLSKYEIIEVALKLQQNEYLRNINEGLIDINSTLEEIDKALVQIRNVYIDNSF